MSHNLNRNQEPTPDDLTYAVFGDGFAELDPLTQYVCNALAAHAAVIIRRLRHEADRYHRLWRRARARGRRSRRR